MRSLSKAIECNSQKGRDSSPHPFFTDVFPVCRAVPGTGIHFQRTNPSHWWQCKPHALHCPWCLPMPRKTARCRAVLRNLVTVGSRALCWALGPLFSALKHLTSLDLSTARHWIQPQVTWLCSPSIDRALCPPFPTPSYLNASNFWWTVWVLVLSSNQPLSSPLRLYPPGCYLMLPKSPPWQILWFSKHPPKEHFNLPFTSGGSPGCSRLTGPLRLSLPKPTFLSCFCQPVSMRWPCTVVFLGFQRQWGQKQYHHFQLRYPPALQNTIIGILTLERK